jgi:hypothetical protein
MSTTSIVDRVAPLFPDDSIVSAEPFAPDTATATATAKAAGYGAPIRIALVSKRDGVRRDIVFRVGTVNELGHDRRADRAADTLLAYDDFNRVPCHVRAVDVGASTRDGRLVSLRDWDGLYLIAEYAPGTLYADDLRRIARGGATAIDLGRVDRLVGYLAELHATADAPIAYRRSIRDLVGHGEGIFGVVDNYPGDVPGATLARICGIERRCVEWRWRLREHEGRACRIHGDFHPFNIVFDGDRLTLLDASRGTCGDPVDDLTALAVNYLLFALDEHDGWHHLRPLWQRLWAGYARARTDPSLLRVAPPFFAWRALVVCNPRFYPKLGPAARDALLGLVETYLDTGRLDPEWADELFR